MSQMGALGLALFCVCLTAAAQVLLKMGMSSPAIQQAMSNGMRSVYWLALTSPLIWGGMICFGASAGLWLLVLGKLEVSMAYPLISLGVVLTTLAGIFILGETVSIYKVLGVSLVIAGVLVLSVKS
ncbi:EamA family transporter [Herminiimonas fonticola]|uniref:EamA-like transporter family protein n=1 Tax=Herminiimonas fonticola TaxID=303380 RepID=A0A4R6GGG8_9BURK|nr:EamA family transporter [Herminiimonas fonticola]RBA24868.1 EamA-like transporter family [Herminiimonas fonticola]TDN93982.1 EamA-like transporter family protein [Herminiimonas fonticola]